MAKRLTVLIGVAAVMAAAVLVSCSDDEWGDIFRWPPLERKWPTAR